jgi:hypothetical protein
MKAGRGPKSSGGDQPGSQYQQGGFGRCTEVARIAAQLTPACILLPIHMFFFQKWASLLVTAGGGPKSSGRGQPGPQYQRGSGWSAEAARRSRGRAATGLGPSAAAGGPERDGTTGVAQTGDCQGAGERLRCSGSWTLRFSRSWNLLISSRIRIDV